MKDYHTATESFIEKPPEYSKRHGGPYDRGSADAYYRRSPEPHYFEGDTYSSKRISESEMTAEEIKAYLKGYEEEEDRKEG